MEMNTTSQQVLSIVKKNMPKIVAYTNKDYVCNVTNDGTHKFYNEPKVVEYTPSPYIVEYCQINKNKLKTKAIFNLLERKKIARVIIQSFKYLNIHKLNKESIGVTGFKPSKV